MTVEPVSGGICAAAGFTAAGVACGIKASGAPDLAIIACDRLAPAAGVFTANRAVAAPVVVSREHLWSSHGLFFSQRLLLALVEAGLTRDAAYRLVQRSAMRSWDEGLPFRDLVAGDEEVAGRVDLDAVFDLGAYTRHVDVVFDRLAALATRHQLLEASRA